MINVPDKVNYLLKLLRENGHEAYVVGGCVRDSLLGVEPKDWDICSSAFPEQTKEILHDHGIRTIDTGIKHGTITAYLDDANKYEITTFRVEGKYSDYRHPDQITYVKDVRGDLARRDFTINAMAYDGENLIDEFGGWQDLKNGVISCVGNADERFSEDGLRILRALRFSSSLGFRIEENTSKAIHSNKYILSSISAERIRSELIKILRGKAAEIVLLEYSDVTAQVIPEIKPCIGFNQNNAYHYLTVYDHMVKALSNYQGEDDSIRVALFLHDVGKPYCYSEDDKGGHFYRHSFIGKDIAEKILTRLRFDNHTKNEVLDLILYHDYSFEPNQKVVRRWLYKIGEKRLFQLIEVKSADIRSHSIDVRTNQIEKLNEFSDLARYVIKCGDCFTIKDLKISGHDVMNLGLPQGPEVGMALNVALRGVIAGDIDNDKEEAINYILKFISRNLWR